MKRQVSCGHLLGVASRSVWLLVDWDQSLPHNQPGQNVRHFERCFGNCVHNSQYNLTRLMLLANWEYILHFVNQYAY